MKITNALIIAALWTSGCTTKKQESSSKSAGVPVGQLRGYKAISTDMKNRLFTPESSSTLEVSQTLSSLQEISEFMGSFAPAAGEFVNGAANSVNVLLWDLTISNVAHAVSGICGRDASVGNAVTVASSNSLVRTEVSDAIRGLCLAADAVTMEPQLDVLWNALMMFDAPDEEMDPWKAFVKESRASYPTPQEWVRGAIRAAFMNPYFLLNQ